MPTLLFCLLCTTIVFAQETPKYEIGANFALIRLHDLDTTDVGVGARAVFNLNKWVGFEAEMNTFPKQGRGFFEGRQKVQGLFGVKAGKRMDKFGLFAKARPGFMHFADNRITNPCPPGAVCILAILLGNQTNFAVDLGGVVEFYPSRRFTTRIDVGDTIVRFGNFSLPTGTSYTSHNLQVNVGFGVRFK
jgi:hypothetical protein